MSGRLRRLVPFAAAVVLAACSRPDADNLLLVSFDTTRADRLSAYGYRHPTSPHVAALAERGALFENAYTQAPMTAPAHASMFTGDLPPTHGVRGNGVFRLPEEADTLAEILGRAGFATGAVLGALPLHSRFGFAQGFEHYDDDFPSIRTAGAAEHRGQRDAAEVTERALAWLDGQDGRWFLFVHYFDPHAPYEPPPAFAERFPHPYDAEIAWADHQLGRLLEAVARRPGRTLIVFTSDHGEGLGQHGEPFHNRFLYDSTLRVPLVIVLEGVVPAGTRLTGIVGHVVLLPTLLDLLGVEAAAGNPRLSVAEQLRRGVEPPAAPVYSETVQNALDGASGPALRALVEGSHKLIWVRDERGERVQTRYELYDLAADPGERNDLARTRPELVRRLAQRLVLWTRVLERTGLPAQHVELDAGTLERLRSLGYLIDPQGAR